MRKSTQSTWIPKRLWLINLCLIDAWVFDKTVDTNQWWSQIAHSGYQVDNNIKTFISTEYTLPSSFMESPYQLSRFTSQLVEI